MNKLVSDWLSPPYSADNALITCFFSSYLLPLKPQKHRRLFSDFKIEKHFVSVQHGFRHF